MINLESIAAKRAQEQMESVRFDETEKAGGMPMTGKVCELEGCGRRLGKTNKSGFCYRCSQYRWRRIEKLRNRRSA